VDWLPHRTDPLIKTYDSTTTQENLRSNREFDDRSKLLPSDCATTDPNLVSPVGGEAAPGSGALRSGIDATSAVVTIQSFGCSRAALRSGDFGQPIWFADANAENWSFEVRKW
jgi:hypothetical protein